MHATMKTEHVSGGGTGKYRMDNAIEHSLANGRFYGTRDIHSRSPPHRAVNAIRLEPACRYGKLSAFHVIILAQQRGKPVTRCCASRTAMSWTGRTGGLPASTLEPANPFACFFRGPCGLASIGSPYEKGGALCLSSAVVDTPRISRQHALGTQNEKYAFSNLPAPQPWFHGAPWAPHDSSGLGRNYPTFSLMYAACASSTAV